MFAYDKTFDSKVVLGHYDLISWLSDFPLYLGTQLVYEHTSFMICLRMTRTFLVHCDLISWFSDFALYLDTQFKSWYFVILLSIMNEYDQTFNLKILIGHYDLISLYLNTQWVYDHISFTL